MRLGSVENDVMPPVGAPRQFIGQLLGHKGNLAEKASIPCASQDGMFFPLFGTFFQIDEDR